MRCDVMWCTWHPASWRYTACDDAQALLHGVLRHGELGRHVRADPQLARGLRTVVSPDACLCFVVLCYAMLCCAMLS